MPNGNVFRLIDALSKKYRESIEESKNAVKRLKDSLNSPNMAEKLKEGTEERLKKEESKVAFYGEMASLLEALLNANSIQAQVKSSSNPNDLAPNGPLSEEEKAQFDLQKKALNNYVMALHTFCEAVMKGFNNAQISDLEVNLENTTLTISNNFSEACKQQGEVLAYNIAANIALLQNTALFPLNNDLLMHSSNLFVQIVSTVESTPQGKIGEYKNPNSTAESLLQQWQKIMQLGSELAKLLPAEKAADTENHQSSSFKTLKEQKFNAFYQAVKASATTQEAMDQGDIEEKLDYLRIVEKHNSPIAPIDAKKIAELRELLHKQALTLLVKETNSNKSLSIYTQLKFLKLISSYSISGFILIQNKIDDLIKQAINPILNNKNASLLNKLDQLEQLKECVPEGSKKTINDKINEICSNKLQSSEFQTLVENNQINLLEKLDRLEKLKKYFLEENKNIINIKKELIEKYLKEADNKAQINPFVVLETLERFKKYDNESANAIDEKIRNTKKNILTKLAFKPPAPINPILENLNALKKYDVKTNLEVDAKIIEVCKLRLSEILKDKDMPAGEKLELLEKFKAKNTESNSAVDEEIKRLKQQRLKEIESDTKMSVTEKLEFLKVFTDKNKDTSTAIKINEEEFKLRIQIADLSNQKANLLADLETSKKIFENTRKTKKEIIKEINNCFKKLGILHKKLAEIKQKEEAENFAAQNNALLTLNETLKGQKTKLQTQFANLKQEITELNNGLETPKNSDTTPADEKTVTNDVPQGLIPEFQNLKENVISLKTKFKATEKSNATLVIEKQALTEQLANLEQAITALNNELEKLTNSDTALAGKEVASIEKQDLTAKFEELHQNVILVKEKLAEVKNLETKLKEKELSLNSKEEKIGNETADLERLKNSTEELKAREDAVKEKEKCVNQREYDALEKETKLIQFEELLNTRHEYVKELEKENSNSSSGLYAKEEKLKEKETELLAEQERLSKLDNELIQKKNELNVVSAQLAANPVQLATSSSTAAAPNSAEPAASEEDKKLAKRIDKLSKLSSVNAADNDNKFITLHNTALAKINSLNEDSLFKTPLKQILVDAYKFCSADSSPKAVALTKGLMKAVAKAADSLSEGNLNTFMKSLDEPFKAMKSYGHPLAKKVCGRIALTIGIALLLASVAACVSVITFGAATPFVVAGITLNLGLIAGAAGTLGAVATIGGRELVHSGRQAGRKTAKLSDSSNILFKQVKDSNENNKNSLGNIKTILVCT